MPNKNPFVNCKSRKRRKIKNIVRQKPEQTVKCPRSMVLYSNSPNEYKMVWICKMCLTAVLSESAVDAHVAKCNETSKRPAKLTAPAKKDEDMRYICEFCNRVFSRKVTLKKHMEQHEYAVSGVDSGESDGETMGIVTEEFREPQDNKS